ncbi:uncharacterized protein LOC119982011 isoform X2 [Tripterygium wilfordii]|uniref:uncharacterized protein LOC119982011 isoform X2 n=1 Tax=Tripterygium wilfordii TaxID=458696 RepID=UPI0018F8081A|nr:uncharacterized protein LOC119982011 isoform X2 [Tripterygium wilfordii]XP_038681275.1 uncharacterized protein LOC119982011 isoform X2 [Tripterygium wilfordii]
MEMEELLKPYSKEYMRMAMLKHEETFKEQVYELHRLYRIQKLLMKSIASNRPPNGRNQPAAEENYGDLEIIYETEIELTLGPSRYDRRKQSDTPLMSDLGPSFSSSSIGSKSSVDVEEQLRQQRLQQAPPWLFQFLMW